MKLTAICAIVTLAAAGTAFAQTPPTADQAKQDVNSQKQDPLAMQTSSPEEWDTLSGHDKGYIAKADAMPNSWLAQNFKSCDKNQDGKVSQQEYQECAKKQRR